MKSKLTLNLVTHFSRSGKLMLGERMKESLKNQTDKDFHLNILINNCNYKKSDYDLSDLNATVYEINEVKDLSYARNFLIDKTETDHYTQLDSDDYISNNYVELINKAIERYPDKLIKFGVDEEFEDGSKRYFPYIDKIFTDYTYDYMFNASYVFNKNIMSGFRYPEGLKLKIEDQLAFLRYFLDPMSPVDIYYINDYLYHYIKSDDSYQYQDSEESDKIIFNYLRPLCKWINVIYV